jgi:hypothetical protein
MTQKWKLVFGRDAFRQFIDDLSPFKARFVAPGERNVEIPAFHQVIRAEMLARFLAMRPDLTAFRLEFADVCSELSEFPVDTSRWNALVPA